MPSKAVMLFLFAAEMIAATDGLAYRRCGSRTADFHPWFQEA